MKAETDILPKRHCRFTRCHVISFLGAALTGFGTTVIAAWLLAGAGARAAVVDFSALLQAVEVTVSDGNVVTYRVYDPQRNSWQTGSTGLATAPKNLSNVGGVVVWTAGNNIY